jgi:formylglycine-generating enzyme required for sulfatase activity
MLVSLLALIAGQTGMVRLSAGSNASSAPDTVTIASHPYSYREAGEFVRGTMVIDAPRASVASPAPLDIMKYQVSAADYTRCVAEGACKKAAPRWHGVGNVPVTGVNFKDATDYAAWLTAKTGATWRLPTMAEWTFAAGSKAPDDALGASSADPSTRWLLAYEQEAAASTSAPATPQPLGSFGVNEYGVADLSGVVWEWTSTCDGRTALGPDGQILSHLDSCGVRYLEGRHLSPMTSFVRDAQGGGCSSGVPPDNLGFRLVRDRPLMEQILAWLIRSR